MTKKPESKFSQKLTKATADKVHWTRIESWALPGVPDLHGCYAGVSFWLECKVVPLPSVKISGLTIRQMMLRPHQIQWQMQYARNGGRVYNLVHRPSSNSVQLYEAASLREDQLTPTIEESYDVQGLRSVVEYIVDLGR